MRTQVPYLTQLARPRTWQAALRPPRRLFPSDSYAPVRWPDPVEHPVVPPPHDRTPVPGSRRSAGPGRPALSPAPTGGGVAEPARPEPAAGQVPPSAGAAPAPVPGPAPRAGLVPPAIDPVPDMDPAPGPAPLPAAGPRAARGTTAPESVPPSPAMTPPGGGPPSPAHVSAAPVQAPRSWTDPLWGAPVARPATGSPVAGRGGTEVRTAPPLPPRPTVLAPAETAGGTATSGPGLHRADPHDPTPASAAAAGSADPDWPPALALAPASVPALAPTPTPTEQLQPPARPVPRPAQAAHPRPADQRGEPGRPSLSIGTIEVTVVQAPPPAPGPHEFPSPVQAARGRPRSPAEGTGAGRLADGLRRWYGTAQS